MKHPITESFSHLKQVRKKGLAMLLDPDKVKLDEVEALVAKAESTAVDFFFVGGSLLTQGGIHELVRELKLYTQLPVILFPSSVYQIVPQADAILFLSLISGRNPELLIGQHVVAAPLLKESKLEVISTGYMLVDSGKPTTAHYISNTHPIPYDKPDIALCTALAGEYLGLKVIYMDGGSGAEKPLSEEMIRTVKNGISVPLIIGGGIRSVAEAVRIWDAGADIIVIGNALEQKTEGTLLEDLAAAKSAYSKNLKLS